MNPAGLKTTGYLISTASVLLLGLAAWPGARKAGLEPLLLSGMFTSIMGMACRWYSYEIEKRQKAAAGERSA
jgi:hypothetical protein